MNKSSSHERCVKSYLKVKNHTLFKAYVKVEEMGDSEGINHIVNSFFNMMSPEQKQNYLQRARNINSFK